MPHIEIEKLHHNCRLISANAHFDAMQCKQRIEYASEETLPSMLALVVGDYIDQHFGKQAIVCIRKLSLQLDLLLQDINSNTLPQKLAQSIAAQIQSLSTNGDEPSNCIVFKSDADYAASFVEQLLSPSIGHEWCFHSFHYAQHLNLQETLVAFFVEQQPKLAPIAEQLSEHKLIASMCTQLDDQHAQSLVAQWCKGNEAKGFTQTHIETALSYANTVIGIEEFFAKPSNSARDHDYISAYLGLLSKNAQTQSIDLTTAHAQRALLSLFCLKQYAKLLTSLLEKPLKSQTHAINYLNTGDSSKRALNNIVHHCADYPNLRSEILRLIKDPIKPKEKDNSEHRANTEKAIFPATHNKDFTHDKTWRLLWSTHSEFAGLALLLPSIISMQYTYYYSLDEIKNAVIYLMYEHLALQGDAASFKASSKTVQDTEQWVSRIFAPNEEFASVNHATQMNSEKEGVLCSRLLLGLAEPTKQKILQQQGTQQLASLIMAQFAARLTGLQLSSNTYLFHQFLQVRGSIRMTQQGLFITLAPIPLNIVLDMSGFSHFEGKLAWSATSLTIKVQT